MPPLRKMRTGILIHVTGLLLTVGFFLQLWTIPLRVLFLDRTAYEIPKDELVASGVTSKNHAQLIPKIIHQVYNMWSNGSLPEDWEQTRQSCLHLHKDYEYILWNYSSSRELIASKYPWFLNTFDNYRFPVQRADAIRYFILVTFGGIYLDLDTGCAQRLDRLLTYPAFAAAAPSLGLTNSIMGTVRDHPFFLKAIESLQAYDQNWILPYLTIMNSAGPHFLSEVWVEYLYSSQQDDEGSRVRLLMPDERQGKEWSMFFSVQGSSWHNWDNRIFIFVHNHVMLVATGIALSMCIVAGCVWWACWKIYSRVKLMLCRRGGYRKYESDLLIWDKQELECNRLD